MADEVTGGAAPAAATRPHRPLTVRYFAAAADSAGVEVETLESGAQTIGELESELGERHPGTAAILEVSAYLLGDELVRDRSTALGGSVAVDVLPPFAGG